MEKGQMQAMLLDGNTYRDIAEKAGISRQRVQQILSPPKAIRDFITLKYNKRCLDCGLLVNKSGHIHHQNSDNEVYNNIDNLVLLCISCHRIRHGSGGNEVIYIRIKESDKLALILQAKTLHLSLNAYCVKIIKEYNQEGIILAP